MREPKTIRRLWVKRVREYLPGFLATHPILSGFSDEIVVIFHGSTMMGIDDRGSDLDFWMIVPERFLKIIDAKCRTRFIEIKIGSKQGHLNAESVSSFREQIEKCDMDIIHQLRYAEVVKDKAGIGKKMKLLAAKPMKREVRDALFFYHYVEMRGEHRSLDNPVMRGDSVATLLSLPKAIGHALRAAIVLDSQPYPYDKWIFKAAQMTPTGKVVARSVEKMMQGVSSGALRSSRLRKDGDRSPFQREMMRIRHHLISAALKKGIRGLWLKKWWLFIDQARNAMKAARW